ncbi:hypothetical protein OC842_002549 [Tilletia horrida]|uniref:DUF159-domain-containing protein n=1 Tax=Tilletia horrida TaxID=155126 RepID=A0AAN6GD34_9BASI|nr:hypothetical protein OC842_002549 [Tilletia horrida]
MCGRFSNGLELDDFRQAVRDELPDGYEPELGPDADKYNRSYNVAPQTRSLVLRAVLNGDGSSGAEKGNAAEEHEHHDGAANVHLVLQSMKWGLVPRSTKHPPKGPDAYKTINARDDTILSGSGLWAPLFKRASHRCVVLVQGFYEWQKRGADSAKPERIAHFVGMGEAGRGRRAQQHAKAKGEEGEFGGYRLMALAGLWEKVRYEGESEDLYTFTIITTSSNAQLDFLHDRMPVILPDADAIALWLGLPSKSKSKKEGETGLADVAKLLKPFDRGELQCYRVPPEVGKVGNSDPKFILPVADRKDGIMAAFGRASAKAKSSSQGSATGKIKKEEEHEKQEAGEREVKQEDTNSETHAPLPSQSSDDVPSGGKKRQSEAGAGETTPSKKKSKTEESSTKSPPPSKGTKAAASPQRTSKAKSAQAAGSRDIRSFFS